MIKAYLDLLSKLKIHPLFYFVLGVGVLSGYFKEVVLVFAIVWIHEMGHAVTAHFFKWKIVKIELLPFGGVAEINENGNRPLYEEFFVIIAGPVQHVWMIAVSFLLVGNVSFWSVADHEIFVWHNLVILCFNLLPVWPLDGGRFVQLLYSYYFPFRRAQTVNLTTSCLILCIIIIAAFYYYPFHLNLWTVLTFLCVSNYLEWRQRHFNYMRFLLERMQRNRSKKKKVLYVEESTPIQEVIGLFQRGKYHYIYIRKTNKTLKESEILQAFYHQKKMFEPIVSLL